VADEMTSDLDRLKEEYRARDERQTGKGAYGILSPGHLYLCQQRQWEVAALLRRHGFDSLGGARILEVGCGAGGVLRELVALGASPDRLHGVDLLDWRLHEARRIGLDFRLACADGQNLPYADGSFDLVLQYTAFSSILDPAVKRHVAAEMLRVLASDGLVIWYDFWLNPTNRQTQGIRPAEVRALFPSCRYEFRRTTLAPPIARRLARQSRLACSLLESLRLLNTHYLVAIRPGEPERQAT
jgi:ubiquinone/menaquinone biosynthesis C-methylase UbiE